MTDIISLSEEANRLEREKRQVESRLRELSGRNKRLPTQQSGTKGPNNGHSERKRSRDDWGPEDSRPKILSRIAVVVSSGAESQSHPEVESDRWIPNSDDLHPSKPSTQEAYKKPDTVQRNKRMLGALMGHLNKAKKNLERDATSIGTQETLKANATEKNLAESKRVAELQRITSREERNKELDLRDQVTSKILLTDLAISAANWKKYIKTTENFIFTATTPRLAWLPAEINEELRSIVDFEKRKEEVAQMIAEREEKDEERAAEIKSNLESRLRSRAQTPASGGDLGAKGAVEDNGSDELEDGDGNEDGEYSKRRRIDNNDEDGNAEDVVGSDRDEQINEEEQI